MGPGSGSAPLIGRASSLIGELRDVVDRTRFVYVAGYNQRTPSAIRVDSPGKFSYRETFDGDGRVPHVLGLLDGVPTYWIFEIHGSLAKNVRVLDAMTDLLQRGTTARLPSAKPAEPAPDRALRRGWVGADEIEPVDPAIDTIFQSARRGGSGTPTLTRKQEIELENLGAADYLGRGDEATPSAGRAAARAAEGERRGRLGGRDHRRCTTSTPSATTRAWSRSAPSSRSTRRSRVSTPGRRATTGAGS